MCPAAGPQATSAESDFDRVEHDHRCCSQRLLAAPGRSGGDGFAGSPSPRSMHANRPQRRQRRGHGYQQHARMPESGSGPPHGAQAPESTALRADKLQRIGRNGRRCRNQGSSRRRRASRRRVDTYPHMPGNCCLQFADGYSVRHGRSGARATMLPMRLCAHCLTRPSQCRSLAHWTMWMWQIPVGSPLRSAGAPRMIARRQWSR